MIMRRRRSFNPVRGNIFPAKIKKAFARFKSFPSRNIVGDRRSFRSKMTTQSESQPSSFSAEEMEFVAEDELIEIVPNMRMEPLNMICGDFGPFLPQIATQVPIWLAVALKKRGKCTIRPPEWMSVEKLTRVLEAERDSEREFQSLPFHYIEISRLLFHHAREDIPDIYMVRSLIEDIRDVRFYKVETSLETFDGRTSAVQIKSLSAMEVNIVRPFVVKALQAFQKLGGLVPESDPLPDSRPPQVDKAAKGRRTLRGR